jgi:hypothetical protein
MQHTFLLKMQNLSKSKQATATKKKSVMNIHLKISYNPKLHPKPKVIKHIHPSQIHNQKPLLLAPSRSPTTTLPGAASPASALSTSLPTTLLPSSSSPFTRSSSFFLSSSAAVQSKFPAPPLPALYLFTLLVPTPIEEFLSGMRGVEVGSVDVDVEFGSVFEGGNSAGLTPVFWS